MQFGQWMNQELTIRELSRAELAARIGVTPGTVSRWVHGRRTPDIPHCERIAVALDIDKGLVLERAGHTERWNLWTHELDREIAELEEKRQSYLAKINTMRNEIAYIEREIQGLREQQWSSLANYRLHHSPEMYGAGLRRLRDRLAASIPDSRRDEVWQTVFDVFDEVCREQEGELPR